MFTKIVVFLVAYCFMYLIFKILDNKYRLDSYLCVSDVIGKWKYVLVFFMTAFYPITIFCLIVLLCVITYKKFKVLHDAKKWS